MELLIILTALFCLSVVYGFFATNKQVKARRRELEQQFGQPPKQRADMESVNAYWVRYAMNHPDESAVDDITWNDLNMDDVFHRINACQTSVGEEMLYAMLRRCRGVPEDWEAHLKALRRDKDGRLNIQSLLCQMGKAPHSGLSTFLSGVTLTETPHRYLLTILGSLPLLALLSMTLIGFSGLLLCLLSAVGNMAYSVYFKHKTQSSLTGAQYLSRMLWCTGKLCKMTVAGLEGPLGDIRALHSLFKSVSSRLSALAAENMSASMADMLDQYARWFMLMDARAYAKSAAIITSHKKEASALFEKLGQLDVLLSVCSFRKSLGAVCPPVFHDDMQLVMERVGHPLLPRPVENSCRIVRGTLITGSNASGKSTFLKAVAVNALLAQSIHTCCAKSFAMPRAQVITSMALRDSVLSGDSYFIAEIKSFLRIMKASRERPCLCFVDEILRGTNTVERIAASAAVLMSLARGKCLCLVASHDIELTRILYAAFDNMHFEETVQENGAVTFDYLIKEGASHTRNAILLLAAMGFEKKVTDRAHELVAAFEHTHSWPVFDKEDGDAPIALS